MSGWQADFLRRVGAVPEVLGCGLLRADRSRLLQSNAPEYPEALIEHALRASSDAFHVLRLHRQEAQRLCWRFERAFLHGLWKRDEFVLAVITAKNFRLLDSTALERLLLEFQQRPPGAGS